MQTFTTRAADKAILYEFTDYVHSANYDGDHPTESTTSL